MTLTEISIRRPVFLLMIVSIFIIFGVISLLRMGSSLIPEANTPFITVITAYPGASSEEIETLITKPLEEAVGPINGIDHIESTSSEGLSVILAQFKLEVDGNVARTDVQKKVDEIKAALPDGARDPIVSKQDVTALPVITLAAASEGRSLDQLYEIIDREVKERLLRIDGVASVNITGQKERLINIALDPEKIAHFSLTILDVVASLRRENLDMPLGQVEGKTKIIGIKLSGQFSNINEINMAPIFLPGGQEIFLEEIATVTDSFKKMRTITRLNGKPALGISIQKQSGTNTVRVVNEIKKEIGRLKRVLPEDIIFASPYDQSIFTRNSINEIRNNLIQAILLTGLILFVFLRTLKNTLIVLIAIPTSIIASFSLMYYAGFTINMLSLMGLGLTIGMLVDNSIVVLENTHRHLMMGKNPYRAALDGRNEIGLAAVAMTLTNVCVFVPIAFLGGFVGIFFREFGLTVVVAILFSLLVSFTLTPMLASRSAAAIEEESLRAGGA